MQPSEPSERNQWRRARIAWAVTGLAALSLWCGPIGNTASVAPPPDAGSGGATGSGGRADAGGGSAPLDAGADPGPSADAAPGPTTGMGEAGPPQSGLHVEGNHFVDNGKTVRLLGVDHSGSEYMCVNAGTAIFEGP